MKIFICDTYVDENGILQFRKDENGNLVGIEHNLDATTVSDDNAYNDAMNQYNYDKSKYDQKFKQSIQKSQLFKLKIKI